MQIMSMCTITNLINLHVALPPDTERVTTVSAVRRAVEGLVLVIITGTTISTPGAASLPSVTCSKLNWNAAEKREKWKRNFIAKVRQRNLTIEIFRRLSTIVYRAKIKLGHLTCGEFSREHKFSWITNTSGKNFFLRQGLTTPPSKFPACQREHSCAEDRQVDRRVAKNFRSLLDGFTTNFLSIYWICGSTQLLQLVSKKIK